MAVPRAASRPMNAMRSVTRCLFSRWVHWSLVIVVAVFLTEPKRAFGAEDASATEIPDGDLVGLRRAAEQGDAIAQVALGFSYEWGNGVPRDSVQAVAWYRKAAEQGYGRAQFTLGLIYNNGWGVPEDDVQAVAWYRKAAEQGNAWAQFNLGVLYANGEGLPKDDVQAYAWFNVSGAAGLQEARTSRDRLAERMTPAQIAEAQTLSRHLIGGNP